MATKKIYPFINAKMFDITNQSDGMNVVFDAREVESYQYWTLDDDDKDESVKVNFKSGNDMYLYLSLNQEVYPGENLVTLIDSVLDSHFWHDNEDSTPDKD